MMEHLFERKEQKGKKGIRRPLRPWKEPGTLSAYHLYLFLWYIKISHSYNQSVHILYALLFHKILSSSLFQNKIHSCHFNGGIIFHDLDIRHVLIVGYLVCMNQTCNKIWLLRRSRNIVNRWLMNWFWYYSASIDNSAVNKM